MKNINSCIGCLVEPSLELIDKGLRLSIKCRQCGAFVGPYYRSELEILINVWNYRNPDSNESIIKIDNLISTAVNSLNECVASLNILQFEFEATKKEPSTIDVFFERIKERIEDAYLSLCPIKKEIQLVKEYLAKNS